MSFEATSPPNPFNSLATDEEIDAAVEALHQGRLVGIPTETVYGLACDATDEEALKRLYAVKGRPGNHPVIVHVDCVEDLAQWAEDIPEMAYELADVFWPGPMTLILKRHPRVLDAITGGQDKIGIRIPNHPVTLSLLKRFGSGLAAPSANRFGSISPTRKEHVEKDLASDLANDSNDTDRSVACVLEGGPCHVGIESTIIDLTTMDPDNVDDNGLPIIKPTILRPGILKESDLADVFDYPVSFGLGSDTRVSGSLPSHYAPKTQLVLIQPEQWQSEIDRYLSESKTIACFGAPTESDVKISLIAASNPADYAHQLYATLRTLDSAGCDMILVETPPSSPEWDAIADRLKRASAPK